MLIKYRLFYGSHAALGQCGMAKRPSRRCGRLISSHWYKVKELCKHMHWYECWHSEEVAPHACSPLPPFFPPEEMARGLRLHHWNVNVHAGEVHIGAYMC